MSSPPAERPTLIDLVKQYEVKIKSKRIPDPPRWHEGPAPYDGFGWECILEMDGRKMTIPYWMGAAHQTNGVPNKPRVVDVLECLLSDASSSSQSFEDWCNDYGYDPDSRKAYATWTAVETQTDALKLLLGGEVRFMWFYDSER